MENGNLIPAADFCRYTHIEISFLQSLEAHGLLQLTTVNETYFLHPEHLGHVEKLSRLHHDLAINMEGLDAVLHLLHQLEQSQQEIAQLRNQLRRYEGL